jgi:hypothetical protein
VGLGPGLTGNGAFHQAFLAFSSTVFFVHALLQRFIRQPKVPVETAIRVYKRYLKLEPEHAEEYVAYLKSKVRVDGCSDGQQPKIW